MSAYIRIELHESVNAGKPDGSDYAKLHELLGKRKIVRSVEVSGAGQQCLPSGFYYTSTSDKTLIGKDVNWAAGQVGFEYSFVIVINGGALVRNLAACSCD